MEKNYKQRKILSPVWRWGYSSWGLGLLPDPASKSMQPQEGDCGDAAASPQSPFTILKTFKFSDFNKEPRAP